MPDRSPRGGTAARDVTGLLMGVTERSGLAGVPGKSGASLERVVIDGQDYVLKHLDLAEDWTMRASGCLLGALVQFGWEKALGGYDEELAWWETHAVRAAALLS